MNLFVFARRRPPPGRVALMVNRFGSVTTLTLTAIIVEEFKELTPEVDEIQVA